MMLKFSRNTACSECTLRAHQDSPCIPMRLISEARIPAKIAVVLIAEKPGVTEDEHDDVFVGKVGAIARGAYAQYIKLYARDYVDFYGTNAVRCMPPIDHDVTEAQAKKCSGLYLDDDLKKLSHHYDRVLILACGGPACKVVFGVTMSGAFKRQSEEIDGRACFATFNPGMLLPRRDPSLMGPVRDHLKLVIDFLNHGKIPMTVDIPPYRVPYDRPPSVWDQNRDKILTFDIETYGAVDGLPEQTVFHPEKSMAVDGVARGDLVQTVAAAWYGVDGRPQTSCWVIPEDVVKLRRFLNGAIQAGWSLLNQNICFDLMYLRATDFPLQGSSFHAVLRRSWMERYNSKLHDLATANFMDSDVRWERTQKELAVLLRIHQYDPKKSLASGFRYTDRFDPELHYYNCADAAVALEAWTRLKERTLADNPHTSRFSPYCLNWYSDLIWTALEMDEAGVEFDREKVGALQATTKHAAERTADYCLKRWDWKLAGKGSQEPTRDTVEAAAQSAGLVGDPRLKMSKKLKIVSTDKENRNLIIGALPVGAVESRQMWLLDYFKSKRDLVSRYTHKFLEDPAHGLIGSRAYPTWYITVTYDEAAGSRKGTQQGRMTCSGPGLQTNPPSIKKCMTSRHPHGVLLSADSSQIELRKMALLSGDPTMMADFIEGQDPHTEMGLAIIEELATQMQRQGLGSLYGLDLDWAQKLHEFVIAGGNPRSIPEFARWRQLGKTINFLKGYRGGRGAFQAAARRDLRIELSLDFCEGVIRTSASRCPVFIAWQDELIARACRDKYIELPLIGDRRTFRGSVAAIRETYTTAIVNFPIQTLAARTIQSAQRCVSDALRRLGMGTLVIQNTYDAVITDGPSAEEKDTRAIFSEFMDCPPFYRDLQSHIGREVPLAHEIKVLARTGDQRCPHVSH